MRLVLFLLWVAAILVVIWPWLRRFRRAVSAAPPTSMSDELVKDPVCQTYVVRSRAVSRAGPAGGEQFFCSAECARRWAGK